MCRLPYLYIVEVFEFFFQKYLTTYISGGSLLVTVLFRVVEL